MRRVFGVSLGILIAAVILAVLLLFLPGVPSGRDRQLRVKLLYETDHRALLDACRELSRQVKMGKFKPGMYDFGPSPDGTVAQFPRAIRELMPVYVVLDANGRVTVAVMGGFDHYGVVFYPDDQVSSPQAPPFGNKQLIDGLWYYDDGYEERSDWQQRLDALKPER